MENYIFVINTILGFFIALIWDILNRNKTSPNSPYNFSPNFFLKDNKTRLILTFILSLLTMLAVYFNVDDAAQLIGKEWTSLNGLIYLVIGAAPDLIISFAKRKVGFLQPKISNGYNRSASDDDTGGDGAVIPNKGF